MSTVYKSSGPREDAPGEFDLYWTLGERGLSTLYSSPRITLTSGGAYTLDAGLEIKINDDDWISTGGTLVAEDIIQVRATSSADYYVDGVSGTVAFVLTIGGVACTFTLINMEDPATYLVDGLDFLVDGTDFIIDGA